MFVFRDRESNAVLSNYNGATVRPIKYPYQHISYSLSGSRLLTEATGGSGDQVTTLRGNVVSVRHMQGSTKLVFTCPVFLNLQTVKGNYMAYENYDYFMDKLDGPGNEDGGSHCSMVRIGSTPPFAELAVMHLVGWRLDSFDDLPETIKSFIMSEDPMWREAPSDLDDIRRMQRGAPILVRS
ncbi:hypothetical protein CBR_g17155 [Chara braunii]|uniref:Uncharacterized protein n=1 Tax=Chara braunii TaxID=69332 RepID=A0A388KUU3_CHABU|nr:hypothetical protein CBR_g17155 [Chara braunii]|eukprot:GBG73817.1 hypothetical protein CBR_g17155 [Chara braunii]